MSANFAPHELLARETVTIMNDTTTQKWSIWGENGLIQDGFDSYEEAAIAANNQGWTITS